MRIVVKLGTNILTEGGHRLSRPKMIEFVRQVVDLCAAGHQVLLVSSGAVFAGREVVGDQSHKDIPYKQMLAAIGQMRLMGLYEQFFGIYDTHVAQALLTKQDLADREQYYNARKTLMGLVDLGIVPVINENDTVATDEIKIGDNDNLSARVANLVEADILIILTDQQGLFTADPRTNPDARLIPFVEKIDQSVFDLASSTRSSVGTGGMLTKIQAAKLAVRSGTDVIIASGREPNVLIRLTIGNEQIGTRFNSSVTRLESRKLYILADAPRGDVLLDDGASKALITNGSSLLPVGITDVTGKFERGQTIRLLNSGHQVVGRGITNYSSEDLRAIKGKKSNQILATLGYEYGKNVVHRDDLVILE